MLIEGSSFLVPLQSTKVTVVPLSDGIPASRVMIRIQIAGRAVLTKRSAGNLLSESLPLHTLGSTILTSVPPGKLPGVCREGGVAKEAIWISLQLST